MASGQTSNYGLNQWAAEDPVLRTDFNQDNAKLDAVLEGFPFIQLARVEAETPTQQLDLDLSNEDLTKYSGYWLYIQLPAVTPTLNTIEA